MADLTDKEITEACARARSLLTNVVPVYEDGSGLWCYDDGAPDTTGFFYNPLTDRAQAMELGESDPVLFAKVVGVWASRGGKDNLLHMICHAFAGKQIEKEKNRA